MITNRIIPNTPTLLLAALWLGTAAAGGDIIPVPRVTYTRENVTVFNNVDPLQGLAGDQRKAAEEELAGGTKEFLGLNSLQWAGIGYFPAVYPPQGFLETVTEEELLVLGKKQNVKHRVWKRGGKGYPNHDVKEFHIYTCPQVKTKLYNLKISRGPGVPLPPGTVKVRVVPLDPNPKRAAHELRDRNLIRGSLVRKVQKKSGAGKVYDCYEYLFVCSSRGKVMQSRLWLCPDIPGGMFGDEMTGMDSNGPKGTVITRSYMYVAKVDEAPVAKNLKKITAHKFAFAPPPAPWKMVKTEPCKPLKRSPGYDEPPNKVMPSVGKVEPGATELVRYELPGKTGKTERKLTIEVVDLPKGKSAREWLDKIVGQGAFYSLSYTPWQHMADVPVAHLHYWTNSKGWTRAFMAVGERRGKAFILCLWAKDLKEDDLDTGDDEKLMATVLSSWRWLRD